MATATIDPTVAAPPQPVQTITPTPTNGGSDMFHGAGIDGLSAAALSQILGASLDTAAKVRDLAITSLGQNTLRKNILNAHGAQTVALDGPYRSNMLGLTDMQKAQIAPFPEVRGVNVNTIVPLVGGGQDSSQQQAPTPAPAPVPAPTGGSTPTPTPTPAPVPNGGPTIPTPAPAPASSGSGWLLPAALGAALLGGGLAGGVGINKYYSTTSTTNNPPAVTQPANPNQPPQDNPGVGLKVE